MEQRLMFRRNASRRHNRRHRLDALALARHQQPRTVILERPRPILPAQNRRQATHILRKARFTRLRLLPHLRPLDIQPNQQDSKTKDAANLQKWGVTQ